LHYNPRVKKNSEPEPTVEGSIRNSGFTLEPPSAFALEMSGPVRFGNERRIPGIAKFASQANHHLDSIFQKTDELLRNIPNLVKLIASFLDYSQHFCDLSLIAPLADEVLLGGSKTLLRLRSQSRTADIRASSNISLIRRHSPLR
jgi:hypothetical protein